ncbi:MAG: hypothetical protein JWM47_3012, partial [Acidimicrobiales bacterium]|nr:hypothetical protein [Acidimicrobiales bacterium]
EAAVREGRVAPTAAAQQLLDRFTGERRDGGRQRDPTPSA